MTVPGLIRPLGHPETDLAVLGLVRSCRTSEAPPIQSVLHRLPHVLQPSSALLHGTVTVVSTQQRLTRAELADVFSSRMLSKDEKVGIEVENGLVDPLTGCSVPYEGQRGARSLLEAIVQELSGDALYVDADEIHNRCRTTERRNIYA